MASEPLWRISRADLDKLMGTLEIASVRLSECLLTTGTRLRINGSDLPTIHYGLTGSGLLVIDGEASIELMPHSLAIVPANRSVEILAAGASPQYSRAGSMSGGGRSFVPGSVHRHVIGDGDVSCAVVCGCFHATYGPGLDLFASLRSSVVETFDAHDQIDHVMTYAMVELAEQEIGGGPMSSALFKLALLALLRRCLDSTKPWVERFSMLNDPAIARAFAEMASQPSAEHSVHTLCRSVGLSRSAFMARFGAAFGESPMSVLRRLRMRHAASLLAANALSIDQVALHSGYQSRSSFTRTFRRYYGTDPSDFRGEAQRMNALAGRSILSSASDRDSD